MLPSEFIPKMFLQIFSWNNLVRSAFRSYVPLIWRHAPFRNHRPDQCCRESSSRWCRARSVTSAHRFPSPRRSPARRSMDTWRTPCRTSCTPSDCTRLLSLLKRRRQSETSSKVDPMTDSVLRKKCGSETCLGQECRCGFWIKALWKGSDGAFRCDKCVFPKGLHAACWRQKWCKTREYSSNLFQN